MITKKSIAYSYRRYYFCTYSCDWQCPLCKRIVPAKTQHVFILSAATAEPVGSLCVNCIRDILASQDQILMGETLE